ncbi:MAG: AraC family transcriptional regulator [Myxococcota bacterium]
MATTLDELLPVLAQLSRSRDERHSLASLARQSGRSASTFQRAFSRLVGESPKQYTKRLRLEYAAVLLLTTDDTVLDIAIRVGFESHEGLTRAFVGQFDRPPTEFRAEYAGSGIVDGLHSSLITHVGPCIGLFRASLQNPSATRGHPVMNYDITQQDFPEITFLYKAARCEHAQVSAHLAQILPAIFQYAMKEGIEMVGPPTTVYVKHGPGMVTFHAGMPVKAGSVGADDIEVCVHPAGPAAVTIHSGAYDGLGDAHAAVEQYLHEHGLESSAPPREVYLTDPGEVPNPEDWKTQVIWPVK